jgi:hypothetical protein
VGGWWVWGLVALAAPVPVNYRGIHIGVWVIAAAATVPFVSVPGGRDRDARGKAGNSLVVSDSRPRETRCSKVCCSPSAVYRL